MQLWRRVSVVAGDYRHETLNRVVDPRDPTTREQLITSPQMSSPSSVDKANWPSERQKSTKETENPHRRWWWWEEVVLRIPSMGDNENFGCHKSVCPLIKLYAEWKKLDEVEGGLQFHQHAWTERTTLKALTADGSSKGKNRKKYRICVPLSMLVVCTSTQIWRLQS